MINVLCIVYYSVSAVVSVYALMFLAWFATRGTGESSLRFLVWAFCVAVAAVSVCGAVAGIIGL